MDPAKGLETLLVEGLNADTQAVDASILERDKFLLSDSPGIDLDRDLRSPA